MDVIEAINKRRAYRSLDQIEITDELIKEMAQAAQLAPSCFNNQPWRLIFVRAPEKLEKMKPALSSGNEWVYQASLIIVVMSRREDDCLIGDREYHHFDCGLAAAFLILRATELGLVAHPIAGFSPKKVRAILGIPEDYHLHTLIIVGRKAETISPFLSEKQIAWEKERPERLPFDKFVFIDQFPTSC
ncbi:MAG: nitroreductase family protein [Candidatus Aminicenantes bacterium]|nr:nitroreductase family protein [Candidatus Aminicenantes bacterium]